MGVQERKVREKEQRRIDILDSARLAFIKHGLEQTSMDRIAQEAELAKGTLYLYFRNRDELLMALIANDFEHLIEMIEVVQQSAEPPERKLLASVGTFYEFSRQNEFFYKMMTQLNVHTLFQEDGNSEPVCHFRDVNKRMMSLMASIVQEGVDKGVFHIAQSVEDVVVQMMVALKGAMVILRNGMIPPDWVKHDIKYVLHNIACLLIRGLESPKYLTDCDMLFGNPNETASAPTLK
ncbi:MAG: TetR/AcrR family transcriptional regulator [Candidatus Kapabacteria bacterium]|nr:TetR/AcrR family transcriptional regulator [Candidatus Kapabacteria bacterium]